ncbi:hypothetical protein INT45_009802 [Circinella minor]|uniref:Uncharacterized protein n=1 Tax=Circinella minor TaxID=1195481 RepID=A0A8H7RS65_9FUNG|nr:hypothetical protein INT45_009802 [Circinella minor]
MYNILSKEIYSNYSDNITLDRRQRWRNNNRETEKRNSRRITRCKRALKLANKVKYGDIKTIVAKMIDTLFFDIYDDLSAEGLPRYVIVAFIIQEAELQLKSRYEIEDVDDGPADIFGYCANVYSYNDFQESFPSAEDKQKAIKKAGKIIEEKKMKALGTIIPYLLVHSWYPSSIFSQTRATFPTNVFGSLNEAPTLRGDSDSIGRDTEESDEREREETVVGNGNHAEVEYIIISDDE